MASKNFVKEVILKVGLLEISEKAFYDNQPFLKMSINGEFFFIERPKSSKITGLSRTFFA